jgi:hypothetical protein
MEWTDASVVLDVEYDADTIAFGVLVAGKRSVDVCGIIRFEAVTADVPTTNFTGVEEPVNLDFGEW